MIVAAAVCPGAPLLIAGVAPAVAARVPDLLAACDAAIAVLAAADRLLVVAGPPVRTAGCTRTARLLKPGSAVMGWGFTRSDCEQPALLAPGPRRVDTPATIATPATAAGLALLGRGGAGTPTWVLELGLGSGPTPLAPAADQDRWGVLALADGSACHGGDAPGRADERAPAFDAGVAAALGTGDPTTLQAAIHDPRLPADELLASCAALDLLAAWTVAEPPTEAAVHYAGAPFGVGYLAASWVWGIP
jgi:hypothetical protein